MPSVYAKTQGRLEMNRKVLTCGVEVVNRAGDLVARYACTIRGVKSARARCYRINARAGVAGDAHVQIKHRTPTYYDVVGCAAHTKRVWR